jgi:hypothetical protein
MEDRRDSVGLEGFDTIKQKLYERVIDKVIYPVIEYIEVHIDLHVSIVNNKR